MKPAPDTFAAQQKSILSFLRHNKEVTLNELHLNLDIASPTKRISELRQVGWNISGTRAQVRSKAHAGALRSVIAYTLHGRVAKLK